MANNQGIEELPQSSFSSGFSIESTNSGNIELLNDLFGSETSTASPTEIQPLEKEKPPVVKKEEVKKEETPKEEEKSLTDQLLGEEEEEEQVKEGEEGDEPKEGEVNQFQALAKDLFKLGVFSQEEGETEDSITSPEQFLDRFVHEKKKGANEIVSNFIAQFGDDYQEAFEAIYVKGVDPKEYWTTYSKIENLSELDLTKESNQEAVVRQALRDQGYDDDGIQVKIDKLKQYGDLPEESQHAHKVLLKKDAQRLQDLQKTAEQRQFQTAQVKQQYIANVTNTLESKLKTSEFDGIPINPKLASEIQDFLITEKYKTPSGETLTDFDKTILDLKRPENHTLKVKVALLLKLIEKDPTLSTIQKAGVTKKTDALFQEVARQSSKTSVKSEKQTKGTLPSWSKLL